MDYQTLVDVYNHLEQTTKRLEKTYWVASFLKHVSDDALEPCVLLVQGRIFPAWAEQKIGVASRLVMKAINLATGLSVVDVEHTWKTIGDLGEVAKQFVAKKKQVTLFSASLTIEKVFSNLRKLSQTEGSGSVDRKVKYIAELLTAASPDEAKYIVRTVLEDLRVGVGDGVLRDALVWAFVPDDSYHYTADTHEFVADNREQYTSLVNEVQRALDMTNDFTQVASALKRGGIAGLKTIHFTLGNPIKVMLFQKAHSMQDAFNRVGTPAAVEFKYDGFRLQIHKTADGVFLFTRRLENVTHQFPELVSLVADHVRGDSFVLDSEAVGYDRLTGKYLPFQNISQRIKRKYDIDQMAEKFPVELNIFDIISYEGKNYLEEPFQARRALLERIVSPAERKIVLAKQLITSDVAEADQFYQQSLALGNEGVMLKNLSAIYKPGSRVGYGVKVKPVMESLDLVIVGAEWGTGKRAGWLTSFTLACIDDDGNFLEIGKVGTGFKEKEAEEGVQFERMTELLKPLIIGESGKEVKIKPAVVIEIAYEEIQKSPTYSSGYALRFPRMIGIRDDVPPEEADSLERIEEFYFGQEK